MSKRTAAKPQQLSNLYRFIRLVLRVPAGGKKIPDRVIAQQWDMDNKNFSEFKYNRFPVPRVARLVTLAKLLKVDDHLVYEVAKGVPAERVYKMISTPVSAIRAPWRFGATGKLRLRGVKKITPRNLPRSVNEAGTEADRRYRELFVQAGNPIMTLDVRTRKITDCNKQAEKLLGRTRTEIIGMDYFNLYPPDRRPSFRRRFGKLLRSGVRTMKLQIEIMRPDGQLIPIEATANLIQIDGRPVIQGIFRAINDRKMITVNYIAAGRQKARRAVQVFA